MRLSAEEAAGDYRVVDARTGEPIDWVVWADDEAGEYVQMVTQNGEPVMGEIGPKYETKRGSIRIEKIT